MEFHQERGFFSVVLAVVIVLSLVIGAYYLGTINHIPGNQVPNVDVTISSQPLPTEATSTTKPNDTVYFDSKGDCENKTGRGCQCMLTALDTASSNPECTGWQPQSY